MGQGYMRRHPKMAELKYTRVISQYDSSALNDEGSEIGVDGGTLGWYALVDFDDGNGFVPHNSRGIMSVAEDGRYSCSALTDGNTVSISECRKVYAWQKCQVDISEVNIPYSIRQFYFGGTGYFTHSQQSLNNIIFSECGQLKILGINYTYNLTSLVLPNGLLEINGLGCNTNLDNITFPDTLCISDKRYFTGTKWYEDRKNQDIIMAGKLVLKDSIASGNVVFNDSVVGVGYECFKYNSNIASVTFSDDFLSPNGYSFYGCNNLQTVDFGDSTIEEMGVYSFAFCNNLRSVILPAQVKTWKGSEFYRCTALSTVTIPETLTSIGNHTFEDCASLSTITIPHSIKKIGNYAFCRTALTSVTIASDCEVGADAFPPDCVINYYPD